MEHRLLQICGIENGGHMDFHQTLFCTQHNWGSGQIDIGMQEDISMHTAFTCVLMNVARFVFTKHVIECQSLYQHPRSLIVIATRNRALEHM